MDNQSVLSQDPPPADLLFWRRRHETVTLRRNPLLCAELGTDLPAVVAIDVLHTLCLGIHQQFVVAALWACVRQRNVPDYRHWLQEAKKHQLVTPVSDMSMELIGKVGSPVLKAKGHETLTLLCWLNAFLPTMTEHLEDTWASAANHLVQMYQKMSDAPMEIPEAIQEALGKRHPPSNTRIKQCG